MAQKAIIDFFTACTGCSNETEVREYLQSFNWDLPVALDAYFIDTSNRAAPRSPHTPTTVHRVDEPIDTRGLENSQAANGSNATRPPLFNSFRPDTSDQTNKRMSLTDHVERLEASPRHILPLFPQTPQNVEDKRNLMQQIDSNINGKGVLIPTPCGTRKAIYADYTASGRSLLAIEQYISNHVAPYYANTHSDNNAFARRTTKFRESARKLIRRSVNATDDDVVIFTGSGSTSAINKLVEVLGLRDEPNRSRTVVFISTFEHHSNILPWTESGVEWIRIPNNAEGLLDEEFLERALAQYARRSDKKIICSFSAGSNVTGILLPVDRISAQVHRHNGWIFWDYAAAAPYEKIDMNPSVEAAKDAVFISTHKFVGGPSTPGLLIAKKHLYTNRVPVVRGGGTVNSVTRERVEYTTDIETREEGGTPEIIGSIRAGLVMHLKDLVGHEYIARREREIVQRFRQEFDQSETLRLLGPIEPDRLAIFSFLIEVPTIGKYLHHNFVCSLLNDLFGIQVRSGCSCAGPYVLDLLGISDERANIYTKFVSENPEHQMDAENIPIPYNALMKPGFTRFNLAYFIDDAEVDFILEAVKFVSTDGWRLLPLYTYNQQKGTWHIRAELKDCRVETPDDLDATDFFNLSTMARALPITTTVQSTQASFLDLVPSASTATENPLAFARALSEKMPDLAFEKLDYRSDEPLNVPEKYEDYIWFASPKRAMIQLLMEYETKQANRAAIAFRPRYGRQSDQA